MCGAAAESSGVLSPWIFDSVKIPRDCTFFAMGSCFAREIKSALIGKVLNFLNEPTVFNDEELNPESGSDMPVLTYVTKYHAFSILNAN